jgi:hypothetical protein
MLRVCICLSTLSCCVRLLAGGSSPIAVFMDFKSEPSGEAVLQMEQEISNIMKPSGLEFDWRMMKDRQTGESFRDLIVFTFKGHCKTAEPTGAPTYDELGPLAERQPLAFTRISEGHILPFSDVECDTVRRYIASSVASAQPGNRESILGRALGRVVAHEMYHMLASTTVHAEGGVARSFHTRKDLTGPEFHFTARETKLLRARNASVPNPQLEVRLVTRPAISSR